MQRLRGQGRLCSRAPQEPVFGMRWKSDVRAWPAQVQVCPLHVKTYMAKSRCLSIYGILRISCTSLYHCLTRRETQVQRMWRQIHLPTRSAKGPVQGLWRFPDMRAQSRAQQVRCMWWRFYLPAFAPEGPVQRLQSDIPEPMCARPSGE